jgi:hypothetical protein
MEIASRNLKVILRNPDNNRTCELKYDLKIDRWVVRCFTTTSICTCFDDMDEWPTHDDSMDGVSMLNSYEGLEDAVMDFHKWTS